jgi:hypothetical protein
MMGYDLDASLNVRLTIRSYNHPTARVGFGTVQRRIIFYFYFFYMST